MISSAYDVTSITQGELVNIGFSVYDPVNMTTDVELIIQQNDTVYFSTTKTVDRTRQFWSVRDYPVGEVTFTIRYGAISKSHIINVTESSVNVSTKDTDLESQLKAAGRSNSDNNREVWVSGDVTTTFENFNWDSTGWVQDENGDVALRCSGDSRATNKALVTTTDSCWLASYDEVGFVPGSNNLYGQGQLYSSIFSSDKESRKKYIVDDTETGGWWLRSTYYTTSNSTMFWRVQKSGASYGDIKTGLFYVAFGFCI